MSEDNKPVRATFSSLLALGALVFIAPANANSVDYPPNGPTQYVAANDADLINIWTSVAQSFSAAYEQMIFGFYVRSLPPSSIRYNLYIGDGLDGTLIATALVEIPFSNFDPILVEADFSNAAMIVGDTYTVEAQLPDGAYPQEGEYSDSRIFYHGTDNPYAGGRFYFGGSPYDLSNPVYANRDIAFRITDFASIDTDSDGVTDVNDNCLLAPNADQRDSDEDGFGNICDADFDNNCIVNVIDLGSLRSLFFSNDPNVDLNGDGTVNSIDLGLFRTLFFFAPGPSGLASCP